MSKPASLNAFHWRETPSQLVEKERPYAAVMRQERQPRIVHKVDAVSTRQVLAYSKAIATKVGA